MVYNMWYMFIIVLDIVTINWATDFMKITLSCSVSMSVGKSAFGSYLKK
jgi:hypothetical protein